MIDPLSQVILDASTSLPGSGSAITSTTWTLLSRPQDSRTVIQTPAAISTGFAFEGGAGLRDGIDVLGTYEVQLLIGNDIGGTATTNVTVQAIPEADLYLQLTWDTPTEDLDLHLRREEGIYCNGDGVFYGNQTPDWDGLAQTDGDPTLLIDDLSGYGPEAIAIPHPEDATYRVAIHLFTTTLDAPVNANLNIFVNSTLFSRYQRTFLEGDRYWEVADVTFPVVGLPFVSPVDLVYPDSPCAN